MSSSETATKPPTTDLLGTGGPSVVMATWVESTETLYHARLLQESLQTFAGRLHRIPLWVFMPSTVETSLNGDRLALEKNGARFFSCDAEPATTWYFYAGKVFAAAEAEREAAGSFDILIWVDEDTLFIREPDELLLPPDVKLAYRPVMHRNIGSLWDSPPDEFWTHLYKTFAVPESALFPMVTPADNVRLRPYFNAGLIALRPEAKIFRAWADCFIRLAEDPLFRQWSQTDRLKRVFFHQAVLVGAILTNVRRDEMRELPPSYNYPIFFETMFGAVKPFRSLGDATSLRYDMYFRNPAIDWYDQLDGPAEIINWLRERFPHQQQTVNWNGEWGQTNIHPHHHAKTDGGF